MYNYENQDYLQHLTEKSELWYQDVLAALLSVQPKEVLELGCGDGGFSRLMAEQKIRVLALDHSKTLSMPGAGPEPAGPVRTGQS